MRLALCCLLLSAALLSCSTPAQPPPDSCSCDGRICGTVCGTVCGVCPDDGVCEAAGTSCRPALAIGAACAKDLDCGAGRTCLAQQAPGGYCSRLCSDSNPCPAGSECGFSPQGERVCLVTCDPAGAPACRASEGYKCTAGVCGACVGKCDGRSCGDDGCGGSCGECGDPGSLCDGGRCGQLYTQIAVLTSPRFDFPVVEVRGEAVLVGGREVVHDANGSISTRGVKKVERFSRAAGTFQAIANLPEPLAHAHVAVLDDVIYVAGGTVDADQTGVPDVASAHMYRQSGGIFVPLSFSDVPEPSMNGAFVNVGGRLFLLSGQAAAGPSNRMDEYDAKLDKWSAAPARPTKRTLFAAVSDGQRLYVLGGWDGAKTLRSTEIFDPSSGWSAGPDLPTAVAGSTAVVADGRIFLFGGIDGPGVGDLRDIVQTLDLTSRRMQQIGTTWGTLLDQSPVRLRDGSTFLFGGFETAFGTVPVAHDEVLQLKTPAP